MRIVGRKIRDEIELDPVLAYRRGRALDALLRSAAQPMRRGIYRASHAEFNRMDELRMVELARRVNTP